MENAGIVMVVFALNEHGTYDVSEYITDVLAIHGHPTWAIVGNKVNLVEMGNLDLTLVNKFAEKHEVPLVFTSAKNNMNVQDVFLDLVTRHVAKNACFLARLKNACFLARLLQAVQQCIERQRGNPRLNLKIIT